MDPNSLPIRQATERIVRAVQSNSVVVVESPTGSGKTTQIPQILYDAGWADHGMIGVTQPRRIATVSVCRRIAREMDSEVGDRVGYKMRFDDHTSGATRIKVMTDGILLQEMAFDRKLGQYGVIMIDEAHERSLNIDFALGLLKWLVRTRTDLRVIVSSATLDAALFSRFFPGAAHVRVDARTFPVQAVHARKAVRGPEDLLGRIEGHVRRFSNAEPEGDILVFLPGEALILACCDRLRSLRCEPPLLVLPLFGRLSPEDQDSVFATYPGRRKVVVATNIAETSVTIDGVCAVVDSGLAKVSRFDHETGIATLREEPISRASSDQRLGRAGRTAPGTCYRLYSQHAYQRRPQHAEPEVSRVNLSEVVLRLLGLGVYNVEAFDFPSPPDPAALAGSLRMLQALGAIHRDRRLTPEGKQMLRLPMEPHIGRMVVEANDHSPGVTREVITIGAFLSVRTPFALSESDPEGSRIAHRALARRSGDFRTWLHVLRRYEQDSDPDLFCRESHLDRRTLDEVTNIRDQVVELVGRVFRRPAEGGGPFRDVVRCVAIALSSRICRRVGRTRYRTIHGEKVRIHPGSALFGNPPECFVAGEIVRTSQTWARNVERLDPRWVSETLPGVYRVLFRRGRR